MSLEELQIGDEVDLNDYRDLHKIADYGSEYDSAVIMGDDWDVHLFNGKVVAKRPASRHLSESGEIGFGSYESRHDVLPVPLHRNTERFVQVSGHGN